MKEKKESLLIYDRLGNIHAIVLQSCGNLGIEIFKSTKMNEVFKILHEKDIFTLLVNTVKESEKIFGFLQKIRGSYRRLPVIAVLEDGKKDRILRFLQAGAGTCLEMPVHPEELHYYISRLVYERREVYNPFSVKYEERTVVIPNDFSLVGQVINNVVYNSLPVDDRNRYLVALGLSEVVNNAIEHGNLGISFEEKDRALKTSVFFDLANERAKKHPYNSRIVTIKAKVIPQDNLTEYSVQDEGDGFDWRKLPDTINKEKVLSRSGRGIMIAKQVFKEVVFNEKGNRVTLVYQAK
jgi:anti-sigma regulatory factor (Ser/Thr protein kinase)